MLLTFTLAAQAAIVTAPLLPRGMPVAGPVPPGIAVDVHADETVERVRLTSRDKVELAASYYRPRTRSERVPAALVVHDAGGDRTQVSGLAEALRKRGFGVLTLDLRSHGESATKDLDWSKLGESERDAAWALARRDVEAAMEYLRERSETHSSHLAMVGVGAGSSLVLRHSADDENVRAVILVRPEEVTFGYDIGTGVADLQGLPCLIVSSKEAREVGEKLREEGEEANGGLKCVELQVLSAKPEAILEDKRLGSSASKWLAENVQPRPRK